MKKHPFSNQRKGCFIVTEYSDTSSSEDEEKLSCGIKCPDVFGQAAVVCDPVHADEVVAGDERQDAEDTAQLKE